MLFAKQTKNKNGILQNKNSLISVISFRWFYEFD